MTSNDFSAITSFEQTGLSAGNMFLEEHLLLFVLEGANTLTHGNEQYVVRKDEMILLPKATIWEYRKEGNRDNNNRYETLLFFLKYEFLNDFVKMANINSIEKKETVNITVKPVEKQLEAYLNSIKPYFDAKEHIDTSLIRLKIMELLYDLALTDKYLLLQILQLRQPVKADIASVMEQNYTNRLSLSELAYLSGRSLSSFKRDFLSIYNISPSQWIRERRLKKAYQLLSTTSLSVMEICYMTGFENTTHFSRIFKEKFGHSPSKKPK